MSDLISRQAAIDAMESISDSICEQQAIDALCELPPAQPTLYGYHVEHLAMIARVLQKENFPPERVTDALMDIGRIVAIVRDEYEETLRKAVEQCRI